MGAMKEKKSKKRSNEETSEDKMTEQDAAAEKRAAKKAEKERLMALVPKSDEHGIAYSKLELRRMRKRVARGLPPIESEEERRQREVERQQEDLDAEWKADDERPVRDETLPEDEPEEEEAPVASGAEKANVNEPQDQETKPPPKKKARTKPVPEDYVCSACQNQHQPAHWIYDCPDKIHRRKGTIDNRCKVFVSGLPFDSTPGKVREVFSKIGRSTVKLLHFHDSKRCNGQAYVTFGSETAAEEALKMNGTTVAGEGKRKDLKLRVTKALNRSLTTHPK